MLITLENDLKLILDYTSNIWEELRNKHIFISGGTGFIGAWLLESFLYANEHMDLNAKVTILSRTPETFTIKAPHLANNKNVFLLKGDITSFAFHSTHYSHVIHAATETSHELYDDNPISAFDIIVEGMRNILDFAIQSGTKKLLFISSGAIYGKQPPNIPVIHEDYIGAPLLNENYISYSEGKRVAEMFCHFYANKNDIEIKIARCFSIVGPYMPLNQHFAAGNFIRNILHKDNIRITGDGTPVRSYLYAADLSIWLWTILLKGKNCRPYNVGSDSPISITKLANIIADNVTPRLKVIIERQSVQNNTPDHFIPSIERASSELNLKVYTNINESLKRTIDWYKHKIDQNKEI